MREIDPTHVKETRFTCSLVINWLQKAACSFRMFERSCLRQRRLFTFVRHYASREVSCGILTKVCRARRNYFKLSCFLHYPLTVWSHIFTGCSQGEKATFGNMLCPLSTLILTQTVCVPLQGVMQVERKLGGRLLDKPKQILFQFAGGNLCLTIEELGPGWRSKLQANYQVSRTGAKVTTHQLPDTSWGL